MRNDAANANALLRAFYASRDQNALSRLLDCVQPGITQRLSEKGLRGDELADLCGEAVTRLIGAMQRSATAPDAQIGNALSYALTVADSVFEDYIRRTKPEWCRLKRRLLYLLDNRSGGNAFARWQLERHWLGGLLRWKGQPFRATRRYADFCENAQPFLQYALQSRSPEQVALPVLLAALFHWLQTPLPLEELTTQIATLQRLQEPTLLSIEGFARQNDMDEERFLPPSGEDVSADVLSKLATEAFCVQLFGVLRELPLRQRHALLLAMSRDEALLLATVLQLAAVLELSEEPFLSLWRAMPLTDREIAGSLDITVKQVANLRKCARERIARWMQKNATLLEA